MKGQISNSEFIAKYPNSMKNTTTGVVITKYGRSTWNYWYQHEDGSWTNFKCKTDG